MRKYAIRVLAAAALALVCSCNNNALPPRPAIPLVEAIVRDTSGMAAIVAKAGHSGADGSVAIIGEPAQSLALSRLFRGIDVRDNIDGRPVRDSLPDFAGEQIDVFLDALNAPFSSYVPSGIDSLREAAVQGAMFAWDSLCLKTPVARSQRLSKSRAKILVFASPLHSAWGLFDVDTLQQLCGGASRLFTPVEVSIDAAVSAGAQNIAVWASKEICASGAYESAFSGPGSIKSITPEPALDIRTEFRSLLRQYLETGRRLDALILSAYDIDTTPLRSELAMIRRAGTDEDLALSRMLSPGFAVYDPGSCITAAVYRYMREQNLFTHRIALPAVRWFETVETDTGEEAVIEVGQAYVHSAYVQDFD